jgi:hypothetical protein
MDSGIFVVLISVPILQYQDIVAVAMVGDLISLSFVAVTVVAADEMVAAVVQSY